MRHLSRFLVSFFMTSLCSLAALPQQRQLFTVRVGECSFDMVRVEGGSFLMGADQRQWSQAKVDEAPQHGVQLSDYYLGRYEVSQQLWKAVMHYNPSNFRGSDLPVEQVSYYEVLQFIEKLNSLTGLHFRLPTEAEWEYAARGGQRSADHLYAGSDRPEQVAWFRLNSHDSTHAVGYLAPNELGISDLNGNVWEWCSDWYYDLYYLEQAARILGYDTAITNYPQRLLRLNKEIDIQHRTFPDPLINPRGPTVGECKVGRGGSWTDDVEGLRTCYRNFWPPERKLSCLGFRLALDASDQVGSGWMPNQYLIDSVVGDKVYMSTTTTSLAHGSIGMLDGLFSVAPNRHVRFSKGNLQYNAVANAWRFANNQYDVIGPDNVNLSKHYAGWVDLFAWGTSGYRNHPPYYTAANPAYYGNGNANIEGTSYDWGVYNDIDNGGSRPALWRTLTVNEWAYLLLRRPNADCLMALGSVDRHDGIILLPDDWLQRGLDTLHSTFTYQLSLDQWRLIERAGAVFLPTAGYCNGGVYRDQLEVPSPGSAVQSALSEYAHFQVIPVSESLLDPTPHTSYPVSAPAPNAGGPPILTVADLEFYSRASAPATIGTQTTIGYYWTSIHYDRRSAVAYLFYSDHGGYLCPVLRNCRLAVRLVADASD